MKSLYVTSVERNSGKTGVCLALGLHFQEDGFKAGYIKPLSLMPWSTGEKAADEDAGYAKKILKLDEDDHELSPVIITPDSLVELLSENKKVDLMAKVKQASEKAGDGKDILLLEGGNSLREGYAVGLPTPAVAEELGSFALAIIRYRDHVQVMDDTLAAQLRLGRALTGIILNRVPKDARYFVEEIAAPHLEDLGVSVYGILPEVSSLESITVQELSEALDAEVLTKFMNGQALVERLTVGAMTAETAMKTFRKQSRQAIITGGDRTDIQMAALETSATCLILTGNLRPSPLVIKQAEEFGVTVLLTRGNTMESIQKIERVFGKTRLGQANKLKEFRKLMDEHFKYEMLYEVMGLKR